jgi:SAM-dependent methyltransferase
MQSAQFEITAALETRHWWFTARRSILRAVAAEVVPPSRDTRVVDLGCGAGANAAALDEIYTCCGVDCSSEAIALARRRFPRTQFFCGRAPEDTEALIAGADLVLLADVLEHVEDDRELVARVVERLRPGACLVITVPADKSLWSRHDQSHGHYRRYDQAEFAGLWRGLPVRVEVLSYFNARLFPLVKAARTLGRWRGRSLGPADTDLALPPAPLNWLLKRVLAGEQSRLLSVLRGRRAIGYRRGVSLIALLRRAEDNGRAAQEDTTPALCCAAGGSAVGERDGRHAI